jgi:hypothetical protein
MRYLIVLSALVAALALTGAANAGGWATVGIAPTADGVGAGESWRTEITILQHGRTPLDGLTPTVTISGPGDARTFTASPTGKTGVYEARVVFPKAGRWSVVVDSGFGASRLTYGPVTIGASPTGSPGLFPVLPFAAVAAALALAVAAAMGVRRQRRLRASNAMSVDVAMRRWAP